MPVTCAPGGTSLKEGPSIEPDLRSSALAVDVGYYGCRHHTGADRMPAHRVGGSPVAFLPAALWRAAPLRFRPRRQLDLPAVRDQTRHMARENRWSCHRTEHSHSGASRRLVMPGDSHRVPPKSVLAHRELLHFPSPLLRASPPREASRLRAAVMVSAVHPAEVPRGPSL